MNSSELFHLVVRWSHLLSAAAWLGGIIFWFIILNPATRAFSGFDQYIGHISDDFKRLVDTCIFVLLSTGAIMTFNRITPGDIGANYLLILGAKMDPIWDPFGSFWDTFFHPPGSRGARSLREASWRSPGGLPAASQCLDGRPLCQRLITL